LPTPSAALQTEPLRHFAQKHGGLPTLQNPALACFDCNRFKGSDIGSVDPASGKLTLYQFR
jgi:hypothetical protein